jgi:hypothetical protein
MNTPTNVHTGSMEAKQSSNVHTHRGPYIASQVMASMMGVSMFIGGILLSCGCPITYAHFTDLHITSGTLWIVAFSFFTLASLFGVISGIGCTSRFSKSPYHILNMIGSVVFLIGSILMIVGSGNWVAGADSYATFNTTTIIWIIGSSLILSYFCLRNYGNVVDGIYLYHSYISSMASITNGNTTYDLSPKAIISGIYLNGIATLSYTIASVLLLLGAISYTIHLRTQGIVPFQTEAGILWLITGLFYLLGGLVQIAARR